MFTIGDLKQIIDDSGLEDDTPIFLCLDNDMTRPVFHAELVYVPEHTESSKYPIKLYAVDGGGPLPVLLVE